MGEEYRRHELERYARAQRTARTINLILRIIIVALAMVLLVVIAQKAVFNPL